MPAAIAMTEAQNRRSLSVVCGTLRRGNEEAFGIDTLAWMLTSSCKFHPVYNPRLGEPSHLTLSGAILALDVGKRRIGIAVSDQSLSIVRGLLTLERRRVREDVEKLRRIAVEWHACHLLIGRPLHMSGDESPQSAYTEEFAQRLAAHCNLPVIFWDERLSSAHAERLLRESGASIDRKLGSVDRMAAILLLESYLDYLRIKRGEEVSSPGE